MVIGHHGEYDQYYPFQYWNAGASWMLPDLRVLAVLCNRKIPVAGADPHLYEGNT